MFAHGNRMVRGITVQDERALKALYSAVDDVERAIVELEPHIDVAVAIHNSYKALFKEANRMKEMIRKIEARACCCM